ncbi:MAG: cadherin-like beta sandwich domain-containing protein, partial [Clostridiales bacterium]|nr:cadherin-like beta sandwich domain-containing protein [Clostridiales bacterium]
MKKVFKKVGLSILTALFLCCAVVLAVQLGLHKNSEKDMMTANAAANTTVTFAASKTELSPGDTFTLTITVSCPTRVTNWSAINLRVGPLAGDNKSPNTEAAQYLSVVGDVKKNDAFKAYQDSFSDVFATSGWFLVSMATQGRNEVSAKTALVITVDIKLSESVTGISSFTFGINPIKQNKVSFNTNTESDLASTGAIEYNTLTFNLGAPSDDATLSSVSVGHGTASAPLTVADNMTYTSNNATLNNFKVRPVATDSGATITIGKDTEDPTTAVTSGSDATITLSAGVTNITIKVTAADKTTVKRYHITVTSNYVQLSGLTATTNSPTTGATKNGLEVKYAASKTSYKVYVPTDATTVNITATVANGYGINTKLALAKTGSVTIPTPAEATSGTAFAVTNAATGDTLTLTATAADGTTTAVYTLTFEKVSVNTGISSFTMTGKGDGQKYNSDTTQATGNIDYCFILPHASDYQGTFDIVLADTTSTVKVGTTAYNSATNYGTGTHNVTVTAQAGNSRTYIVNVAKLIVPAEFTSLKFSQNGTAFTDVFTASEYNTTTHTFTKKINVTEFGGSTPQIYIGGTTTPEATVTVTGGLTKNPSTATASGEANGWYAPLKIGKNTFTLTATSSKGNMVYTFVIDYVEELNSITSMTIKNAANNTDVSGFTFAPATTSYSVSVPYKTTSVTIAAVTDGRYAVVRTGSGNTISRNNSTRTHTLTQTLSVGANTVKLRAVADEGNGAAGTEYTLTITRQAAETTSKLQGLVVKNGNASGAVLPFVDSDGNPVTFDPNVLNYNIVLPEDYSGVLNVFIEAPTEGSEATVSGAGAVSLGTIAAGVDNAKVLPITVTAEDGSKTTYRVIISQKAIVLDNSIELLELTITGND